MATVGIAGGLSFAPGLTLLACGGYGLYKLLKFIGPKLSEKLEPYLLSDKSKEFANKLYNNKFAKYSLGLKKQDNSDSADSKIKQFGKLIWSIIVNLIIATIVSSIISLFITSIIGTGPLTGLIVAVIIGGKNIFSIILNRILNFKKETITKSGEKNVEYFFDMITMVGILSSVVSIFIKIPKFSQWFDKLLKNVFDFGITKANAEEIDFKSLKFTADQLKASSSTSTENLGSFEGVKNLLNQAENLENPIYGTSNNDINSVLEHTLESSTKNGNYSSASFTKQVLTNLTKSNEDQILYSFKNSISDDNIQTGVFHMFTVSEHTFNNGIEFAGLKQYIMLFNKIYDDSTSKIGFMMEVNLDLAGDEGDKIKFIKGILDASGKIIEIEGANSDALVGKKWDDLIKLMTK